MTSFGDLEFRQRSRISSLEHELEQPRPRALKADKRSSLVSDDKAIRIMVVHLTRSGSGAAGAVRVAVVAFRISVSLLAVGLRGSSAFVVVKTP